MYYKFIIFITIYKKYCNYYYLPSDELPDAISFITKKTSSALRTESYTIVYRQRHNKYF